MLPIALLSVANAADDYDKRVSITLSPIHLITSIVEVTGEGRIADKVGAAGIVGAGGSDGIFALELGASGRYYAVGSFDHGMQVGAEALYVHAAVSSGGASGSGGGVALGPFLGYKIAARFGLTFEVQGGVQYMFVAATATNGVQTASATENKVIPLVNLNLGWSF